MRSSGASEAAPLQMASFRSRVARPDRTSSRHATLIPASWGSLQSLSRERGLARMARRANGSERLSVKFEQQRSGVASRDLEPILRGKGVILAGFHRSFEHTIGVSVHSHLCFLARFDL